jgi:hypothetical protein
VRVGQHAVTRGPQRLSARVETVVQRGQELVEGRREQTVGALDGLELHA